MLAIIRKELRELFWPVVAGAGCFLVVGMIGWRLSAPRAMMVLWVISMPWVALLMGAHAVAKERTHRTLEWHALWPVSRGQWWFGKLLAHFAVLVAGLALVGLVARGIGPWKPQYAYNWPRMGPVMTAEAGLTFLAFALAFLLSTIRRTTFEAYGLALLGVGIVGLGWYVATIDLLPGSFGPRLGLSLDSQRPWAIVAMGLTLGLACLLAAGWAALSTTTMAFRRRNLRGSLAALGLCVVAVPCLVLGGLYLSPPESANFGEICYAQLSPNGRKVAFGDADGPYVQGEAIRLWVVNADGTGLHCVARGPVQDFRWLPDSRRVLVYWGHRWGRIYHFLPESANAWWWLIDTVSGSMRKLHVAGDASAWVSPRGTYVVIGDQLVSLRTCRTVATLPWPLPHNGARGDWWVPWAWARDESCLYVIHYVSSLQGTRPAGAIIDRLDIPSGKLTRSIYKRPPGVDLFLPRGQTRWVILLRETPLLSTLVAIDGSGEVAVPGASPFPGRCISPDGRYAWLRSRHAVYVVDLRARKLLRKIEVPDSVSGFSPQYSHDGRRIAFQEVSPDSRQAEVYVTRTDGSGPLTTRVNVPRLRGERPPLVGWTADDRLLLITPGDSALSTVALDGREATILTVPNPGRWPDR